METLKAAGVKNMMVNLYDWTKKSGWASAANWAPANELGGAKGLKALAAYARDQDNLLSLSKQTVWIQRKGLSMGFINTAAVKSKSLLTYYVYGWHLLNPNYLYNAYKRDYWPKAERLGVNALCLNNLGRDLYFDFNKAAPVDRSETARVFAKLAEDARDDFGYAVLESANAYLFSAADWNMWVDTHDSRLLLSDEAVPFYQMVIHGSIPYTGPAYNLMFNREDQELLAVEYGYLPFFYLTEEPPQKMRDAGLDDFFSGRAADWMKDICETYTRYERDFGEVWNKKITRHKRAGELSVTEYENGVRVYVNHGRDAAELDGVTVDGKSYKVI